MIGRIRIGSWATSSAGTPKSWWALTAPGWECTSQTCSWWSTLDCQRICGRFHRLLEEQAGTKLHKPSPSSFTGRDRLGRQLQHQKWGKSLLESNAGEKQSTMLFHLALCTRLMRNQLITTSALSLVASLGLFAGDWCRWLIDWLQVLWVLVLLQLHRPVWMYCRVSGFRLHPTRVAHWQPVH